MSNNYVLPLLLHQLTLSHHYVVYSMLSVFRLRPVLLNLVSQFNSLKRNNRLSQELFCAAAGDRRCTFATYNFFSSSIQTQKSDYALVHILSSNRTPYHQKYL